VVPVARREILDSDPKPDCQRAKGVAEQLVHIRTCAANWYFTKG
jgi:hypothetical protein